MTNEPALRALLRPVVEDLDPMPDVVPDVLATGARSQRRRRAVAVAGTIAVVAAGVVGMSALPALLDQPANEPSQSEPGPAGVPPQNQPQAVGTMTRAEFNAWAAATFSELLPTRFSEVRPVVEDRAADAGARFVTAADGIEIEFSFRASQIPDGITPLDCAAMSNTDSCVQHRSDDGSVAVASHSTDDTGRETAGLVLTVPGHEVTMQVLAEPNSRIPITDDEVLRLARSREFGGLWREYVAHETWTDDPTYATPTPGS